MRVREMPGNQSKLCGTLGLSHIYVYIANSVQFPSCYAGTPAMPLVGTLWVPYQCMNISWYLINFRTIDCVVVHA